MLIDEKTPDTADFHWWRWMTPIELSLLPLFFVFMSYRYNTDVIDLRVLMPAMMFWAFLSFVGMLFFTAAGFRLRTTVLYCICRPFSSVGTGLVEIILRLSFLGDGWAINQNNCTRSEAIIARKEDAPGLALALREIEAIGFDRDSSVHFRLSRLLDMAKHDNSLPPTDHQEIL